MIVDEQPPAAPFLEIMSVGKQFAGRPVLRGLSFTVAAGETVALIGPSGGGKSTLLRCINGLAPFDAGEVRVGSLRLGPQPSPRAALRAAREVRRDVGLVFQDFQLFPHLRAWENVAAGPAAVRREPLERARQQSLTLLDRVGLADRFEHYPRQLSGGQQQRVAIARALALEPRALLCDEITSALDPELKGEVLAVLEDLRSDGLTLLMVTHEIGFARRAADRVLMLADGQVVEAGPAAQVIDTPREDRTRRFLARVLG